ncbi:MAG: hypothetical protein WDO19_06695 [Bacteroidota bacterium]
MAKVGYERMQEIADPEQNVERARENWQRLGRSDKWIQQRMTGQETRNKLTDYWSENESCKPAPVAKTSFSNSHVNSLKNFINFNKTIEYECP